jgi:hypothetical protein
MAVRETCALVIVAIASIFYLGYHYGQSDMATYVPAIKRQIDPQLFQHDWLLTQTERFYHWYAWGIGQLARLFSLESIFLFLHVVERVGLVVGTYALSRSLASNRLAGFLSVILVLFSSQWNLGGNPLVAQISMPHSLGVVLAIWVFVLGFRGAYRSAALLAGVTTYVHLLIGLEVAALLVCCRLFSRSVSKPHVATVLGLYAVTASPIFGPLVSSQLESIRTAVLSPSEYVAIVGSLRHPWHYLPSTWPPAEYGEFFLGLMAGALAAYFGKDRMNQDVHANMMRLVGIMLGLGLVGTVFVEVIPTALVLKLQLFRLMVFVKLFLALYVAQYLAMVIMEGNPGKVVLAAMVFMGLTEPLWWEASFLALAGYELWTRNPNVFQGKPVLLLRNRHLLLLVVSVAIGLGYALLGAWDGLTGTAVLGSGSEIRMVLIVLIVAFILLWFVRLSPNFAGPAVPMVWIGLALCLGLSTGSVNMNAFDWRSVTTSLTSGIDIRLHETSDWQRLCRWIRENTPVEAVFIAPPYMEDFRLRAERAIVVDFKSFAFRENDALEWKTRLADLTNGIPYQPGADRYDEMRAGYRSLTASQVRHLSRKYGAEFVVIEKSSRVRLPIVYENNSYVLARTT